jgi:selenocysteine lyase/cysteine desulfurase
VSHKAHFSRFLSARPDRLHFAAHSHHPWPDVSFEAHQRVWLDAADSIDDKWSSVFEELIPRLQDRLAGALVLPDPSSLAFAPNTHELVVRLFSCLSPPVRVLTTDAEFHSFARQLLRWEEAGLAVGVRVASEPFDSFEERFVQAAAGGFDLIYLSQVFFDSAYVVPGLAGLVSRVGSEPWVIIDGYHAFMAMPVDLSSLHDRVFYLAGGYKYAMAGEGACFMHCPPGFGPRPVDTGWFAGFAHLQQREAVAYPSDGGRFWGATFDPSGLYRLDAVLAWLDRLGLTPAEIHSHVKSLQEVFLEGVDPRLGELVPPAGFAERGNFLTFRTPSAARIVRALRDAGVITDHRGDRLRIGFGIYHDREDVRRLLDHLGRVSIDR